MNKLQLCNIALSKIGSFSIKSLSEKSEEAKKCNTFLDHVISASLEETNWPCSNKLVVLTLDADYVPFKYNYSYVYPDGALCIRRITCEAEVPSAGPLEYIITNNEYDELRIQTNVDSAYAEITLINSSVENLPPTLIEAISCRLAAELAVPIANNYNLREHMMKMYNTYLPRARVVAANQQRKAIAQNNKYRDARS